MADDWLNLLAREIRSLSLLPRHLKYPQPNMTSSPKPFTEIHPIEASSIPRSGSAELQRHIEQLVAAATEVIESTPTWKSKGKYHHIVEVRERIDWRGKRNWFLRRSVHKDISFDVFKVTSLRN